MFTKRLGGILVLPFLLSACTQYHSLPEPGNHNDRFYGSKGEQGELIQHEQALGGDVLNVQDCTEFSGNYAAVNFRVDQIVSAGAIKTHPSTLSTDQVFYGGLPLSPGDMLSLNMENGEGFNGDYIVTSSGFLNIPYLKPMNVAGNPIENVAEMLELALVRGELFQPTTSSLSLSIKQLAEIEVTVAGAVFEPGRVTINRKVQEQLIEQRVVAFGDFSGERMLSEALRAASGIRPDAKLDQVMLFRNGWQIQIDMSGVVTGNPVQDVALVAGDHVVVPSTGCFQHNLVRPTEITPKGMRVFMSNLIDSAFNNASAAVGRYSSNVPYGTRLLQAAVSANCVGGKQWTNAPRKVLLASTHPLTKEVQVVERSVEQLMRHSHRRDVNPFLMPNDAIACYDSDFTNLRDLARGLVDVIAPLKFL